MSTYIVNGARTPFGKFGGALKDVNEIELGVVATREAIRRSGVDAGDIDEIVFGNVIQTSKSAPYLARQIGLKSGMRQESTALTVNRLCGSGLQAIVSGAQAIALGEAEVVAAGGTENMSLAPHVLRGTRFGSLHRAPVVDDMLWEALTDHYVGCGMGMTAENLAVRYGITRGEQDEFAAGSQRKAAAARSAGRFAAEIAPVTVKGPKGEELVVDTEKLKEEMRSMHAWVLGLKEVEKTHFALVGGKALNLGELSRMEGVQVPDGFCVTTEAYRLTVEHNITVQALMDRLAGLQAEERDQIGDISARIRQAIIDTETPGDVRRAVAEHLARCGEGLAYAVRSSATAEDLPHASFAGQQDSYLNIIGLPSILRHIRKCWASLFTERAVVYRMRNGLDHRKIAIAVIVQKMVFPRASGVLFTADPLTSNRKLLSIEAVFGLGEALVSGRVSADGYKVRNGEIIEKRIAAKTAALDGQKEGGTELKPIAPDHRKAQVLTDGQILQLARIGRRIEAHFGRPQDIEWCLAQDTFYVVQSRPVTTAFPVPDAGDGEYRVYVSVGHQQMMTDPIKPLGLSFFLLTTRAPMRTAGGRLFVDVTPLLASPGSRETLLRSMGEHDPLMQDALMAIVERDFRDGGTGQSRPDMPAASQPPPEIDPGAVSDLIRRSEASIEACRQTIRSKSGAGLFEFILEDLEQLKETLFHPQCLGVITAVQHAWRWINEKMYEWLGERNAADTLSQSVPGNVTSEMGLALLDVADVIRPYPELIAYLRQTKDDGFLEELAKFDGGKEARDAIRAFLDRYGMRCPGEIDITRTRWAEKPASLIPLILGNIKNHGPNAGRRKFERGRQEALEKERELLHRLKSLPDGERKAAETKRMIDIIRNFSGFREYPKYAMMKRYFLYKQALPEEAGRLVRAGVIGRKEDIYYLTLEELRDAVSTGKLDRRIINERKEEYGYYEKLTPPRVITSDGEIVTGKYRRGNLPETAIPGLAVSSGVVEGRARVVLSLEDADLEEGDILVTTYTDPSWTPLFVTVRGLVTEVGGRMTHGAVIAREYGLPAVVGVEGATRRIRDGARIRVNGTEGYIEIL